MKYIKNRIKKNIGKKRNIFIWNFLQIKPMTEDVEEESKIDMKQIGKVF